MSESSKIVRATAEFRWTGVAVSDYKLETTSHRGITRQTLLGLEREDLPLRSVLRYFELQPGGYSSLERHEHEHIVVVLRGEGHVILGNSVDRVGLHDCIYVAPGTFHQFHATTIAVPLGFLCLVDRVRDRPVLPTRTEIEGMARNPDVAKLLKA